MAKLTAIDHLAPNNRAAASWPILATASSPRSLDGSIDDRANISGRQRQCVNEV